MAKQTSSISSFRRFLLRILLPLLLITGAVCVAGDYLFRERVVFNCELCGAYKVNRMINEVHAAEIPVIGSSRAEGGFIPDTLGTNYFNYGLSGTRFDVALFLLQQECRKPKPGVPIIIELDLEGLYYETGDVAYYIPNAGDAYVRRLMGKSYEPYFTVPLVRYYGRFENYYRDYLNNKLQLTRAANKGAALEKNVLTPAEFGRLVAQRKSERSTFYVDAALADSLRTLIAAHKERTFIFVVAPYHSSYYSSFKDIGPADSFMSMLRAYSNAVVLDYGQMPLGDSLFFNTSHVNYQGAIAFSHALRDTLKRITNRIK